MQKWPGAAQFVPETRKLGELREAVQSCRGCDLYRNATQAVLGDGRARASLMIVGETPGDAEDKKGKTFVGPAGRLLMQIFEEVGASRGDFYLTNAVKHFKFEPRGIRRIHSKPLSSEVAACHAWVDAEIRLVRPKVILCLGATAAQSFLGSKLSVTRERGKPHPAPWGSILFATWHPSAVLRAPDEAARVKMHAELRADLVGAMKAAHAAEPGARKAG